MARKCSESAALRRSDLLKSGVACRNEEVTGKRVPYRAVTRRPGDPPVLVADPSRAQSMLSWKAQRSLREIVSTAWNWHQNAAVKQPS